MAANSSCALALRRLAGQRVESPCRSANSCTGEGCKRWPRPAGRGGWVYTAAMRCPAAISAERIVAANSGVPIKTSDSGSVIRRPIQPPPLRRSRRRLPPPPAGEGRGGGSAWLSRLQGAALFRLGQLAQDDAAL